MASFDLKSNSDLYNQVIQHAQSDVQVPWAWRPDQNWFNQYTDKVNNLTTDFSNSFQNLVGRAPTQDELSQFVTQYVIPNTNDLANPGSTKSQDPNTYINSFVGNTFQQQAKDYATQQLQNQQSQATDLANQYRTMGQQALDSTSQYLQNYDQQLFNRLQPQILTSLQSQGLLNTGGLNEALAGAQKDLAGQAQGYLADANLQMQNQANQIQFGGASAPYQYQQANILNQVPYMQQQAGISQNNAQNTFMNQLQFQDQLALQSNYFKNMQDMQPSFMRTLGQSFAGGFGNSVGSGLGQWFSPGAGSNQSSGNYASLAGALG